jgi:hypothetical protein
MVWETLITEDMLKDTGTARQKSCKKKKAYRRLLFRATTVINVNKR